LFGPQGSDPEKSVMEGFTMAMPGFVVRQVQHFSRRAIGPDWRRCWVWLGTALAAAVLASSPDAAQAQNWPTKPIKFVVAYPAGGGADFIARLFSERMSKLLDQPVVVENRPGAGGTLGALSVVRADPDGYTLLIAAISEISIAPATYKALPYDPEKDLVPVVQLARWPQILVASPSFAPNTLSELIAYVKANPGKVSYSSFGNNTLNHVNGERFKVATGTDALHVPYRGSGPALTDLMGGQIQYTFDAPSVTLNLINSGKIKAIAVAATERLPNAGNIPTFAEAGLPFIVSSWIGMMAPPNTPQAIVDKLNKTALEVMSLPETRAAFEKSSLLLGGGSPADFAKIIHAEIADYRALAPKIGIVPQ
jgi:tripartite-type tricarboxylate transporter receptor subunit TctC